MFQDVPLADMSVRRRILLMSIVLTFGNLALTLTKSSRVYLFEQARCLIYYQVNDSTKIDSENGVKESLCKLEAVQRPLSILVGTDAILSMLPGKVSYLRVLSMLSDRSLGVYIPTKLVRSALGLRYLSAAPGQGRSAKTRASELVLLSHRRYPFYHCVYVNSLLL